MYKLEFYKTFLRGQWRWRVTASNGKIVGASTESYKNKKDCIDNAMKLGTFLNAHVRAYS